MDRVTSVELSDIPAEFGKDAFSALRFQASVEQKLFENGNGSQASPAQQLIDFTKRRISRDLPDCSYISGIYSAPLHELSPGFLPPGLSRDLLQLEKNCAVISPMMPWS